MAQTVSDEENPMLLHNKPKEKKKSYLRGEPLPLEKETKLSRAKKKWDSAKVRPYVAVRDFNNDPDAPGENKPVTGVDVGLRFSF